ncbi:TetR/AcrR family transcriptional regulator [Actinomadura namibiensis]|uniref:TetR/AcrR family transcriptional regulator n=1 Tax=Actinomadura kijaniata TaxID=46161 RepID=UPI00360940A0
MSRDEIIDAAVALVYEDPRRPLTIKRVAAAVESAPMALYRYFPDRDDLLQAVADRVVAGMRFDRQARPGRNSCATGC